MNHLENVAPFAFTGENLAKAQAFIAKYPVGRQQSAVIPILDLAQRQEGWVSRSVIETVAAMLEMDPIRVYEVATFYTMFNLKPVGKNHVQLCTNLPCLLRGSDKLAHACKHKLGVDFGETTPDGQFTLSEVECLGACVNAPAAWIGDDYYEDLDEASMSRILDDLAQGKTPRAGSQIGRAGSAPEGGPTTLKSAALTTGEP